MSEAIKSWMLTKATVNDDLLDQLDGIHLGYMIEKHMHPSKYVSRQTTVADIDKSLQRNFACGTFGDGATSLVKKLTIFVKAQGFYRIAMVTVSRNPNLQEIRNGIIQQIQQEWINNCILILDGFWWELSHKDFKAIGIPSPNKSFRIVFTSRNKDRSKHIQSDHIFRVNFSVDEEAWDLFKEKAGESLALDTLHETARKIVDECDRFRSAILTIASTLEDKHKKVWQRTVRKLRDSNILPYISDVEEVFFIIGLTYHLLSDEETRFFFCLCCLFPENSNIPVEDLVLFVKGLQFFKNVDSMRAARYRVERIIHELKHSFFLLNGDDDESVKVHSMCRIFGVWMSSMWRYPCVFKCGNDMSKWPLNIKQYKNCRAISLICKTIKQHPVLLECPNLRLLQLSYGSDSARLPNGIFKGLDDLKVLSLTIPSLSQPLTVLKKLRTLCITESTLDNRYKKPRPRIGDLLGDEMENLEIFSFSTVRQYDDFPREIGLLCNLRYLRFNRERLKYIPPGVLSKLEKLEELYMPLDFIGWGRKEEGGERINANICELESLQLIAVEIGIPKGLTLAEKLINKLTRFHVFIGSHVSPDYEFGTCGGSKETLEVFDVDANDFKASWITSLVWKAESLKLKQVRNLSSIITWNGKLEEQDIEFPQWKKICISDCKELEYLVAGMIPWTCFSQLQSLKFFGLYKLREIWNCLYLSKIEGSCFGNLAEIQIMFCRKLKHVFSTSVAAELRQLRNLEICFCDEMEAIFYRQQMNNDGNQVATSSKEDEQDEARDAILFPQLRTVELAYMDKLRIFYDGNHSILMPSLQSLSIFRCNHLEAFSYGLLETASLAQIQINGNRYIVTKDLNEEFKPLKDRSS